MERTMLLLLVAPALHAKPVTVRDVADSMVGADG
jgi:hypothetical protein